MQMDVDIGPMLKLRTRHTLGVRYCVAMVFTMSRLWVLWIMTISLVSPSEQMKRWETYR